MVQALSGLLQLLLVASLVTELVALARLSAWYVDAPALRTPAPEELPTVGDTARLEGLDGRRGGVRYRWDPIRRVLRFGSTFEVIRGERSHLVGAIRFDGAGRPEVTWRPVPVLLLPMLFLLGSFGLAYFVLVEGELPALGGVPVLAAMLGFLGWILSVNARAMLRRSVLPRLAEVLREQVSGP